MNRKTAGGFTNHLKTPLCRHPGESRGPAPTEEPYSGFRRNDDAWRSGDV